MRWDSVLQEFYGIDTHYCCPGCRFRNAVTKAKGVARGHASCQRGSSLVRLQLMSAAAGAGSRTCCVRPAWPSQPLRDGHPLRDYPVALSKTGASLRSQVTSFPPVLENLPPWVAETSTYLRPHPSLRSSRSASKSFLKKCVLSTSRTQNVLGTL